MSILLLKWKPYSPGIHCEGEPAQEVLILCLRVTWLSEGTGCCNLSLHNLPHRAFPRWSKVSFHPLTQSWSLPDSTQHSHPPKKSQGNSGSGTEWVQDGEQALSLSDIPASTFTHPGRAGRTCTAWNVPIWHDKTSNQTLQKWRGLTGVGGGKQDIPEPWLCYSTCSGRVIKLNSLFSH